MAFSDDEQILIEEKSKLKTIILIVGVGLFVVSLFYTAFCTDNGCRTSIEVLLIGWLAMLTGRAGLTWLVNPLLIISWILILKNHKSAWLYGLVTLVICISFLKFSVIIEDEAGHTNPIIKVGLGYWLWLSSCIVTFLGSLTLKILKRKDELSDPK